MEIISFAINLEHIGDIIDKNLMELAAKKIKRRLISPTKARPNCRPFTAGCRQPEARAQRLYFGRRQDCAAADRGEGARSREAERAAAENHLARLREGRPESIETSSLHLDILRDLKRIHSHICSVAYPVLEAAGELQPSRLKERRIRRLRAADDESPPPADAPPQPS